jgi:hypothetical protein
VPSALGAGHKGLPVLVCGAARVSAGFGCSPRDGQATHLGTCRGVCWVLSHVAGMTAYTPAPGVCCPCRYLKNLPPGVREMNDRLGAPPEGLQRREEIAQIVAVSGASGPVGASPAASTAPLCTKPQWSRPVGLFALVRMHLPMTAIDACTTQAPKHGSPPQTPGTGFLASVLCDLF